MDRQAIFQTTDDLITSDIYKQCIYTYRRPLHVILHHVLYFYQARGIDHGSAQSNFPVLRCLAPRANETGDVLTAHS